MIDLFGRHEKFQLELSYHMSRYGKQVRDGHIRQRDVTGSLDQFYKVVYMQCAIETLDNDDTFQPQGAIMAKSDLWTEIQKWQQNFS